MIHFSHHGGNRYTSKFYFQHKNLLLNSCLHLFLLTVHRKSLFFSLQKTKQKHEHYHKCPAFSMTFIILISLLHVQCIQSLSDAILMELKVNNIPHSFERFLLAKYSLKTQLKAKLISFSFCDNFVRTHAPTLKAATRRGIPLRQVFLAPPPPPRHRLDLHFG